MDRVSVTDGVPEGATYTATEAAPTITTIPTTRTPANAETPFLDAPLRAGGACEFLADAFRFLIRITRALPLCRFQTASGTNKNHLG